MICVEKEYENSSESLGGLLAAKFSAVSILLPEVDLKNELAKRTQKQSAEVIVIETCEVPNNIDMRLSGYDVEFEFSENLATASKHYFVNNPPPSSSPPPSTDLCLSLLGTIPETSTLPSNSNSPNIISQDSCAPKRSFHESNIATPVLKRKGQDQKLVPIKKRRLIAAAEEEHWIIKKLTKSDVNGSSRLLLPRQEVKTYVIPFLDEQKATDCHKLSGTDVNVWDLDTQSEYSLTLKKWETHSFQLIRNWTPNFVKRRNLKQDDVIALRWDRNNSRFCFRVPSRHDHQEDNES
uniref:TF-B3 domain-containing protein n=1 Tax=Nicotiana tabacum TaxID=4097 RepID=A0A1S3XHB6_TOBAC|nr:PREDICTED: uncharacterized protein LOC107765209 [Nicotiana tabacum]